MCWPSTEKWHDYFTVHFYISILVSLCSWILTELYIFVSFLLFLFAREFSPSISSCFFKTSLRTGTLTTNSLSVFLLSLFGKHFINYVNYQSVHNWTPKALYLALLQDVYEFRWKCILSVVVFNAYVYLRIKYLSQKIINFNHMLKVRNCHWKKK